MTKLRKDEDRVFVTAETRALAKSLHHSVNGFLDAWMTTRASRMGEFPDVPDRSTLYNWISGGFPSIKTGNNRHQVLAFCSLLDVDPLAIIDYDRSGFFDRFAQVRTDLQYGLADLGALAPLYQLLKPGAKWPNDNLARHYWRRPWVAEEWDNFDHHTSTDYALLRLRFDEPTHGRPRAAHIAYRRRGRQLTGGMWRYYGWVVGYRDRIALYSEDGEHRMALRGDADELAFRTYYGGRAVEFRVASLHGFSRTVEFPCNDQAHVGFEW